MRIVSIVGARPQFVKVAPISWAIGGEDEHLIIHTGQHYDPILSEIFFQELEIPPPAVNIMSGSGSHAEQTSAILVGCEKALNKLKPDAVLVYGDTNSTLAGALAAAKLDIRIGHVEAGLRSFNRRMPEEINRIVADHISDVLFAPTNTAYANLKVEGLIKKTVQVGDITIETLDRIQTKFLNPNIAIESREYIFATIHRAENTNSASRLQEIISKLSQSKTSIQLYAHPRLIAAARNYNIDLQVGNIEVFEPISYVESLKAIQNSVGVISDSGGIQKEAYLLGKPQLTVRTETEWTETLIGNWNKLDPELKEIGSKWWDSIRDARDSRIFGDGITALKIIESMRKFSLTS